MTYPEWWWCVSDWLTKDFPRVTPGRNSLTDSWLTLTDSWLTLSDSWFNQSDSWLTHELLVNYPEWLLEGLYPLSLMTYPSWLMNYHERWWCVSGWVTLDLPWVTPGRWLPGTGRTWRWWCVSGCCHTSRCWCPSGRGSRPGAAAAGSGSKTTHITN